MAKAKDNRKVVVSDAMAKAKKFKSLKDAVKNFTDASGKELTAVREKAETAYSIKANETFKEKADNIKAWIENGGSAELGGVSYSQFMAWCDMYEYVWSHDELSMFNSNTASALVTYCRKDTAKVIKAVKDALIQPSDTKEYIRETLKPMFGGKCETIKDGNKKASSDAKKDDMKANWAIVAHFIKKNATKGGDVEKAFNELLKYYENK